MDDGCEVNRHYDLHSSLYGGRISMNKSSICVTMTCKGKGISLRMQDAKVCSVRGCVGDRKSMKLNMDDLGRAPIPPIPPIPPISLTSATQSVMSERTEWMCHATPHLLSLLPALPFPFPFPLQTQPWISFSLSSWSANAEKFTNDFLELDMYPRRMHQYQHQHQYLQASESWTASLSKIPSGCVYKEKHVSSHLI